MATCTKFARLSRECVEASHIFLKKLAKLRDGESGESAQHDSASVGESGESAQHGLANVGESGVSVRHVSANVGESARHGSAQACMIR